MSQNPGQSTTPTLYLDNFFVSEGTDSAHNSDSCILALFTAAELYNQPAYIHNSWVTQSSRCHNWMNKENEIVTRRKKIMSFAAKWMKLESIMFSKKKKKARSRKTDSTRIHCRWNVEEKKTAQILLKCIWWLSTGNRLSKMIGMA